MIEDSMTCLTLLYKQRDSIKVFEIEICT